MVMGVDGRLHRINFFNVSNSTGSYCFAIAQTQGPNAATATGGNAYASFLLGAGSSAAFVALAAYTFGDVRRTFTEVLGPGLQNLDPSLIKDTLFEKFDAELRAEFFNLTNTPHFARRIRGTRTLPLELSARS
jgi:hypothetical protein